MKEVINMFIMVRNNFEEIHVKCPYCMKYDGVLAKKIKNSTMALTRCTNCASLYELKKEKETVYSVTKYYVYK